jgi:transcriptional regulator with GAF, ATPase, and Fis domain
MAHWSMKVERQLIQLANSNLTVDQIAAKLDMAPASIIKVAKRLGISLKPTKRNPGG